MILDSERIEKKAAKTRQHLTEIEATVAESMVKGIPFDEMPVDIDREEFEEICGRGMVNCYFWQLVALCNTKEAEIYRNAVDDMKSGATFEQFDGMGFPPTLH